MAASGFQACTARQSRNRREDSGIAVHKKWNFFSSMPTGSLHFERISICGQRRRLGLSRGPTEQQDPLEPPQGGRADGREIPTSCWKRLGT